MYPRASRKVTKGCRTIFWVAPIFPDQILSAMRIEHAYVYMLCTRERARKLRARALRAVLIGRFGLKKCELPLTICTSTERRTECDIWLRRSMDSFSMGWGNLSFYIFHRRFSCRLRNFSVKSQHTWRQSESKKEIRYVCWSITFW